MEMTKKVGLAIRHFTHS